jgi:hypothetical protein
LNTAGAHFNGVENLVFDTYLLGHLQVQVTEISRLKPEQLLTPENVQVRA